MQTDSFVLRHLGPNRKEIDDMLKTVGVESLQELVHYTVPDDIRLSSELDLPEALSENEFASHIQRLGNKNKQFKSYIGMGYHPTSLPAVIQRNIFENPSWYTSYTPYQAEISQGRLEALLNYQTVITDLTGLPIANSSLLDEGTAAAEAMLMLFNGRSRAQKKSNALSFFVSEELFPQTRDILLTRAEPLGIELVYGDHEKIQLDESYFGCIVQYPGKHGKIYDYTEFIHKAHERDCKVVVAADLLSLAILKSPAEMGADVCVGTTQRFGIPWVLAGPMQLSSQLQNPTKE